MNTIGAALDRASDILWQQGETVCAEAVAAVAATLDPAIAGMASAKPIEILTRAALRRAPQVAR